MKARVTLILAGSLLISLMGCQSAQHALRVKAGHTKSFDGVELAYGTAGKGDPTIVFVHGWCCNRTHWDDQMRELAKSHRVVAIDLAGHGESGRGRIEWTLDNFARDVKSVVNGLDLNNVILVGHSMGGPVSLRAAALLPDRVIGVIGVDTLHDADVRYSTSAMASFANTIQADFNGVMGIFIRSAFPPGDEPTPELLQVLTLKALNNDPAIAASIIREYATINTGDDLAACPVPVRCINAAVPFATNVEHNRSYNEDFDAVIMPGVGHFMMVERPEDFNFSLQEQIAAIMAAQPFSFTAATAGN